MFSKLTVAIQLVCLLASHFTSATEDSARCPIDYLRAVIKKEVAPELPALPEKISLTVNKESARQFFSLGKELYHADWTQADFERVEVLARKTLAGEKLTLAEYKEINELRASTKFLRFTFKTLSDDHEVPKAIDDFATLLGKVRDFGPDQSKDSRKYAASLLAAMRPERIQKIEEELKNFHPANRENFSKWLKKTIRDTAKILSRKKGPLSDWHEARKNLQSILAIYQYDLSFHPANVESRKIYDYLVRETEYFGIQVGDGEDAIKAGVIPDKYGTIAYPQELAKEATDFLRRLSVD